MNKLRSWQFVAALVFLLAVVSFTIDDDGAQWMWRETPMVGVVLMMVSLAFWALLARDVSKDRNGREGQRGAPGTERLGR